MAAADEQVVLVLSHKAAKVLNRAISVGLQEDAMDNEEEEILEEIEDEIKSQLPPPKSKKGRKKK